MYQLKAQNGYEIQVIGRGDKGLCRVEDAENRIVYTGTYEECVAWLAARAVRMLTPSGR